jgi:hypothetical protein
MKLYLQIKFSLINNKLRGNPMADKVINILKRIPVIIGFIMMLAGVVLIFALPIMLVPVITETSEDVNNDYEPGAMKFRSYAGYGDFTISGILTEEERNQSIYYYHIDDSEFFISSSEDIGDVDDEVLLRVKVAQDKITDEDYLVVINKQSQIPYNVPGFAILIIGALLFIMGIVRKTVEERESKEKAIARKKAIDKELDMLERELQTTMVPGQQGMPPGGMPPQPGMPPGQMAPGGMPPQQPGMPPGQMAPGGMPPQQPGLPPGQMAPGGMPLHQPGMPPGQMAPGGMPPQQPGAQQQQRPMQPPAAQPQAPQPQAPPGQQRPMPPKTQ